LTEEILILDFRDRILEIRTDPTYRNPFTEHKKFNLAKYYIKIIPETKYFRNHFFIVDQRLCRNHPMTALS
jgi:hypothetical protein